MQVNEFSKNRNVAIYVFWSRESTLDTNTISYVQELLKIAGQVLFVSNSQLDPKEANRIREMGASFLQRENFGFDFWGWRDGIELLKDKIKNAENLILCNSSCFLAFETLSSLFMKINKEAELWGISSFEYGKVPFHIQTYFIVAKERILKDWDYFYSFWKDLPEMRTWEDAVKYGELQLTQFFKKRGFVCKSLIDSKILSSAELDPSIYYPVELIKNGSPLLKKKIFFESYQKTLHFSYGEIPSSALNYIRRKGGKYSEILKELIRLSPPSQLIQVLHLNYLVGNEKSDVPTSCSSSAFICFVYFEDMTDYMSEVIKRFIGISAIFIVSPKRSLLSRYEVLFKNDCQCINFRLQENRGRNEAGYFLTCKDVWENYKIICAMHDKKSSHIRPSFVGREFMRHCEQNLCPSKDSILETIALFEENPLLGLLSPPIPFFGNFIFSALNPLGQNFISISLFNKMFFKGHLFSSKAELDVFSAPFGGMFWARAKAFSPLLESSLSINDFPKEPLNMQDGSILHAMERCYPMIVRYAGFYTARLINANLVPCLYDNLLFFGIRLTNRKRLLFLLEDVLRRNISHSSLLYRIVKFMYRKFFAIF